MELVLQWPDLCVMSTVEVSAVPQSVQVHCNLNDKKDDSLKYLRHVPMWRQLQYIFKSISRTSRTSDKVRGWKSRDQWL